MTELVVVDASVLLAIALPDPQANKDAVADLGGTAQIRTMFAGFQKYLYESRPE